MDILERRLKKFWRNERKYSDDPFDEMFLRHTPVIQSTNRSSSIIRFYSWISKHKCRFLMIIFLGLPWILYIFFMMISNNCALIPRAFQQNQYNLLLIVAHPDDECLFFSPTLRVLQTQYHFNLSLVVFSRGNHVGLGEIRAMELHGSCRMLNIPRDRCISLDLPNIQDDPNVWWSEQQLIPIIEEYVNKWSVDILVSFDNQGISGHLNHRAVGSAVRLLTHNQTNTKIKMSYELMSVSLLRKYLSILDFYWTFISFIPRLLHSLLFYLVPFHLLSSLDHSYILLINTPNDYMAARAAFASHQSQYGWDRHIYLLASRYMLINELKSIDIHV